jgi:hypothetical protein
MRDDGAPHRATALALFTIGSTSDDQVSIRSDRTAA